MIVKDDEQRDGDERNKEEEKRKVEMLHDFGVNFTCMLGRIYRASLLDYNSNLRNVGAKLGICTSYDSIISKGQVYEQYFK